MHALRKTKSLSSQSPETDLNGVYWNYFEVFPAYTEEDRKLVYGLRHQVLCEERRLLDPAHYENKEERDLHDPHALHSLLRYRPTGATVGTLRVILSERGQHLLPTFALCPDMNGLLPMESTVELSRLCISRQLRQRWNDGVYGSAHQEIFGQTSSERRNIPHPALGLFRDAFAQMQGRGVTHVCALMEPALATMLRRLGIHFAPTGMTVDYYGLRQPCYAKMSSLLDRVMAERPDIWHFLTDGGHLKP